MDSSVNQLESTMSNISSKASILPSHQNSLPPSLASLSQGELAAEIERQCRMIALNQNDLEDQAFIDSISEIQVP